MSYAQKNKVEIIRFTDHHSMHRPIHSAVVVHLVDGCSGQTSAYIWSCKVREESRFLYRYGGGTKGYHIEKDKPFEAAAYGSNDENDRFTVGIEIAKDSGIKYVALGNYMDDYHVKEVVNDHVLFVVDEYTEDTWTIRG